MKTQKDYPVTEKLWQIGLKDISINLLPDYATDVE